MWNNSDEEDDYNYSPNELAELSVNNPTKYRDMVNSNLDEGTYGFTCNSCQEKGYDEWETYD